MANKKINELDVRSSLSLSDLMAVGDPSTGYLYKTTISDLKTLTGAGVISFNTRFGAVMPAEGDYNLTQLGDVIITSPTANQVLQFNGSNWVNVAAADLSGFVPYTGATSNVNLGTYDLSADIINVNEIKALTSGGVNIYSNSGTHIALMGAGGGAGTTLYGGLIGTTGSFSSSGSGNTLDITHSSGSGIALNITKSGNGEGLYINKTSGSGNAATIIGTLNATTLVKSGGTSSQFLKADGSVDGNTYALVSDLNGYVPTSRTLTINGTSFDLSANRSWSVGTVTAVTASAPLSSSGGTTPNITISQASTSTNGFLSSTDWNTFNSKQNAITLTTTGSSGAATLVGSTLNIPNYGNALSGYLPLSGGTLTGGLSGTTASFSGNTNADDYNMAAWKILDWSSVTAQIGGIQASQWQSIDFYTNGSIRQSLSNTLATFNVPISGPSLSMSGGGAFATSSGGLVVGTSTIEAFAKFKVRTGTDNNIALREVSGALSFDAYNDATSANIPLRYYASSHSFMAGDVLINTTTTDGTNKLIVNGGVKANGIIKTAGGGSVGIIAGARTTMINNNYAGHFDGIISAAGASGLGGVALGYNTTRTNAQQVIYLNASDGTNPDFLIQNAAGTIITTISPAGAATFSSSVRATGAIVGGNTGSILNKIGAVNMGFSGSGYPALGYNIRYTGTDNVYQYDVNDASWQLALGELGQFRLRYAASGTAGNTISYTDFLTVNNTGAATFSSLVRAQTQVKSKNNSSNLSYFEFEENGNTNSFSYIAGDARNTNGFIKFYTSDTERFSIAGNGAATFSSSVTATDYRGSTASYSSAGTISANITTAFLTGNAYTINMPTATNGKVLIIIAETGLNTNGITLNGVNGGTYLLSCHHSLVLVGNGTTWKIASDYQNSAPCS